MTTTTVFPLLSVYFTTLKRISTQRITDCFQAIGVIDYIDRVPKRSDNTRDEVFIYFKGKYDDSSSSTMFFNNISNNTLVQVYYTIKYYWKVFPNRSKKHKRQSPVPPVVPKLDLNITPSREDYESKLQMKDMRIREYEEIIDTQNIWLDNYERIIKDLKELAQTSNPELFKIFESDYSYWA